MNKLRCLVCGHVWKDESKEGSTIKCPKCKSKEIGTPPKKENKLIKFADSITSFIARIFAVSFYYSTQTIQNILFKYEYDIRNFILLAITISIIAFLKFSIFATEPLYILGAIVVIALLIIKIRF